jgi:hypothetical protein
MTKGNFVAYYRVSTQRQGQSGLGLGAQRKAVADYLNGGGCCMSAEFTEVESLRLPRRRCRLVDFMSLGPSPCWNRKRSTPLAWRSLKSETRSFKDRPNRSTLQAATISTSRRAMAFSKLLNSGRPSLPLVPEIPLSA